ncbi:MAG: hypothetical protein CL608_11515 [Anaerolineaceae bacterium]|nr:hypothetical protein [Anaerolineaceae bacterium]
MLNLQERSGTTRKKTITLTDAGREQIQTFAKKHQMTFSAAIETLALVGMEADLTALLIPLIHSSVEKGMQRQFNRIAKLGLLAAAEAAMAHDLTTMLLLQQIRQEAASHPQNFEEIMAVGQGDRTTQDGRIRAVYIDMRTVARDRQRALLKKPLRELVFQLQGEAVDVVSAEEVETDE